MSSSIRGPRWRVAKRVGLVAMLVPALALGWGYWHALRHASLYIHVDDVGLGSDTMAYDSPHDVTLTFRDRSDGQLATAQSIEPAGYILAIHPSAEVGTCEHRSASDGYASCYEQHSGWSAQWAPRVHVADVRVGTCEIRGVPVESTVSNGEWLLWWVPLPHVGGVPRRHFALAVVVDSRSCSPGAWSAGPTRRHPPSARWSTPSRVNCRRPT